MGGVVTQESAQELRRLQSILGRVHAIAEKELGDYPTSDAFLVAHQVGRLAAVVEELILEIIGVNLESA